MKIAAPLTFASSLLAVVALVPSSHAQTITSLGQLPGDGYSD